MQAPAKRHFSPANPRLKLVAVLAISALAACARDATPLSVTAPLNKSAAITCSTAQSETQQILDWRRSVESGQLFLFLRASSLLRCNVEGSSGGKQQLHYLFSDGTTLDVDRDRRIEWQQLRISAGAGDGRIDALRLLKAAEFDQFGGKGCGVDWLRPSTRPSPNDPDHTETVYEGETCNCKARVEVNKQGRTRSLRFSSAC